MTFYNRRKKNEDERTVSEADVLLSPSLFFDRKQNYFFALALLLAFAPVVEEGEALALPLLTSTFPPFSDTKPPSGIPLRLTEKLSPYWLNLAGRSRADGKPSLITNFHPCFSQNAAAASAVSKDIPARPTFS